MNKNFIYKRRLLKLADFLEKLPPEKFDYSQWVGEDWKGKANLSCGTKACAFGWATTIPSFRKLGLRMVIDEYHGGGYVSIKHMPGLSSAGAAEFIFGLSFEDFNYLFQPFEDVNPLGENASTKEVAKHIRKFVKNKYEKGN